MRAVDAEGAARELLGSSWSELEGTADELIARGRSQVSRWIWIKHGETLWETPLAMAGNEDPMQVLKAEPPPEDRQRP